MDAVVQIARQALALVGASERSSGWGGPRRGPRFQVSCGHRGRLLVAALVGSVPVASADECDGLRTRAAGRLSIQMLAEFAVSHVPSK